MANRRGECALAFGLLIFVAVSAHGSDQTTANGVDSATAGDSAQEATRGGKPVVTLKTTLGDIQIELDSENAPISVENFLSYLDKGFYDGTIFHRVIPGFMVQGGGFTSDMDKKDTDPQIKNEATNGLKNERGTLAMARTSVVDSATAQFFINLVDNDFLNHTSTDTRGYGYAVFARVISGMDVVDKIGGVPTGTKGGHQNVPNQAVTLESAKRAK